MKTGKPDLTVKGANHSQRHFQYVASSDGKSFTAVISKDGRRIELNYPEGGGVDVTIDKVASTEYDTKKGFNEDVRSWLLNVVRICQQQQAVVAYEKVRFESMDYYGLLGLYNAQFVVTDDEKEESLSISIPRITFTGGFERFGKLLELLKDAEPNFYDFIFSVMRRYSDRQAERRNDKQRREDK